jgi:hypothetical protein
MALCSDFTQTQPAGWLNCDLSDTPATWYLGFDWGGSSGPNPGVTCSNGTSNAIFQTTDAAAGSQVLDIHFDNSWVNQSSGSTNNDVGIVQKSTPGNAETTYPFNSYFEATFRVAWNPPTYPLGSVWAWAFWSFGNYVNSNLEDDFMQAGAWGCCAAAIDFYDAPFGTPGFNGPYWISFGAVDPSIPLDRNYHTWAEMTTGSASSRTSCAYLDGNNLGCATWSPNTSEETNERIFPILNLWSVCATGANGNGTGNGSCVSGFQNMDIYVRSIRVWSCSSWQNSLCFSG